LLFANPSYDYARSISTVRYSYAAGLFALANGIVVMLGLSLLVGAARDWQDFVAKIWSPEDTVAATLGAFLLIVFVVLNLAAMALRYVLARREYVARSILIALRQSNIGKVARKDVLRELPVALQSRLAALPSAASEKLALFDLDGTLVTNDVGEATWAALLVKYSKLTDSLHDRNISPMDPGSAFADYEKLRDSGPEGKRRAYAEIVERMGEVLTAKKVQRVTKRVLRAASGIAVSKTRTIPVPESIAPMVVVLEWLRLAGYRCVIVTSTNQWSAEVCAWHHFGIEPRDVIGIANKTKNGQLQKQLETPVPIGEGKVDAVRSLGQPLVAAGNSENDVPMLATVPKGGLVIWVGSDREPDVAAPTLALPGNGIRPVRSAGHRGDGGDEARRPSPPDRALP